MDLYISDFNDADNLISTKFSNEWAEIENSLHEINLHLKASDQAGKQGVPIFDPVGSNEAIKQKLTPLNWEPNKPIPHDYNFLGTDIDFVKNGILVEVQFSNYPFLLNNLLRSELFYQNKNIFSQPSEMLIMITKAHMYDSSNSTLYYEQAEKQLKALSENNVYDIPIRLVGLASPYSDDVECTLTKYDKPRYSRTIENQTVTKASVTQGASAKSRAVIRVK